MKMAQLRLLMKKYKWDSNKLYNKKDFLTKINTFLKKEREIKLKENYLEAVTKA